MIDFSYTSQELLLINLGTKIMKALNFLFDIFQDKENVVKTVAVVQSEQKLSLHLETKNETDAAYVLRFLNNSLSASHIICKQKGNVVVINDSTAQAIYSLFQKKLISIDLVRVVENQLFEIKTTPISVPYSIINYSMQKFPEAKIAQLDFEIKNEEDAQWIYAILRLSAEHARDEKRIFPYTYRLESKTKLQIRGPFEGSSNIFDFLLGEQIINENMFNTLKGQVEDNVHRTLTA